MSLRDPKIQLASGRDLNFPYRQARISSVVPDRSVVDLLRAVNFPRNSQSLPEVYQRAVSDAQTRFLLIVLPATARVPPGRRVSSRQR